MWPSGGGAIMGAKIAIIIKVRIIAIPIIDSGFLRN